MFSSPSISLLSKVVLKLPKHSDIEWLQAMAHMAGQRKDIKAYFHTLVHYLQGHMQVVAIKDE